MNSFSQPQLHAEAIRNSSVLVTGGAGFIGSNIVSYLLQNGARKVRVLDNLSNGHVRNIEPFLKNPAFEFIKGDITDPETCAKACRSIDRITHQAALGSVPRSISFPLQTHAANATGFLNILVAARDAGVGRVVYASSSSVYGDIPDSPKVESRTGRALSPYAVSKFTNELYAGVFALNYGLKVVGLRYFNVFGPRQNPNGPYAAAIPLFMDALLNDKLAYIYGDGGQTRDFTYVDNAVQANICSLYTSKEEAFGKVYNVAVGESVSVNELFAMIARVAGKQAQPEYKEARQGDVRNSLADISQAQSLLGYAPRVRIQEGLERTYAWFREQFGTPASHP